MKHSYYELLIFSEKEISSTEKHLLQAHLVVCAACRKVSNAWTQISPQLMKPVMATPKTGFSTRWLTSVQKRAEVQRKRSIQAIIWSLAGTAMACLIVFLGINLNAGSASRFLNRATNFSQNTQLFSIQIRNFLYIAVNKVPPFVWILGLIAFLGWVAIGCVIWYFIKRNRAKVQYESNH